MNILYIHSHDTGRYIEPYGHAIPTPNLMKLAKEGTIFRNAYCAGPTCSPSRAGMLTGMAAHSCGMLGLAHRGFALNDTEQHLANFLAAQGYETVLCGTQHEISYSEIKKLGYQKIYQDDEKRTGNEGDWYARKDIANAGFAANYIRNTCGKPFFLSFGMSNTHRDFPEIDETVNPNYVIPPFPMLDHRKNREDMAAYITSAKIMDRCVGTVLDALRESGLEDDTLVFFTTDHGIAFPHMKCNLYDTGIGISLIMKFPGGLKKGEAVDALISQIDIFPTICDLLEIKKPHWLQGKSFLPVLKNQQEKIRDEIFSEVTFHAAYEPMRCVRTERYKLIRFYDEHEKFVPANMDDGLSKDFLFEHGYLDRRRSHDMLFDLYFDPVERENKVGDIKYAEVFKDLSLRLENWMRETGDPLLLGNVPKPGDAKINSLESLSPKSKEYVV